MIKIVGALLCKCSITYVSNLSVGSQDEARHEGFESKKVVVISIELRLANSAGP